jgi:hypothetical protein
MKKSYKTTMGVFALAAVALVGSQMVVSAYQGEGGQQKGQGYSEERRATMTQVFADSDFEAWKAQMQDRGRISEDMLTQETFAKMEQVHQKMLAGDYEGAREIRNELGLGQGRGTGQGKGKGMGRHNNENRGQNNGGNFVDANGDGVCDNMN